MSKNIEVYIVVNLTILDPDEYRIYEKGFFPYLKKHNGAFVTYDDERKVLEGPEPLPGRAIIFKFPSDQLKKLRENVMPLWYSNSSIELLPGHSMASFLLQNG